MRNVLLAVAGTVFATHAVYASVLTQGNLVVTRINLEATAGNASATFVDEYTTSGSFVQALAMPTAASGSNFTLTMGGSSTSMGHLTRSADGQYVSLIGYDAPVGTTGPASNASFRGRTIGRIDFLGNVDTSTRFEAAGTTPRAATSSNGSEYWATFDSGSGSPSPGGLRYVTHGAGTNTLLNAATTNIRTVNIYNGQLYIGASTGVGGDFRGVSSVGTGLPTAATTFTLSPGMGGSNTGLSDSTYDFFFADANTLYLTDDDTTALASGGLQKWVFNGTTWAKVWTLLPAGTIGFRSITGVVDDAGGVQLYMISALGSGTAANAIMGVSDSLLSITAPGGATTLATAGANQVFRGIEFTPVPAPGTAALLGLGGLFAARRRR